MKKFKAKVSVNIKKEIKDIKAKTHEQAVSHLIRVQNLKCRVGNIYSLDFEAETEENAQEIVKTVAEEILANSVIEEYEILWEKVQ